MSGRRVAALALASAVALLATAPAASAETFEVEAKDGAENCPDSPFGCFDPEIVEASVGDSVVWGFTQASNPHNVKIVPWEGEPLPTSPLFPGGSTDTYSQQFDEQRAYAYYCTLHGAITDEGVPTGMGGWVLVDTELPSPGPDPLPNPTEPPPWLEDPDETPPKLTKLKAQGAKGAAQISFKLSEAARVRGTLRRNGHKAGKAGPWDAEAGSSEYEVEELRRGRYTVELRAKDDAGNRSKARTASFRVR
jgi:plastocyanin